jgi:hypothetical protein
MRYAPVGPQERGQPVTTTPYRRIADKGEPFALELEPAPVTPDTLDAEDAAEVEALLAQLNADADEDQAQDDDTGGVDANTRLSVYQEITDLLVARGVPREEIAWIHDAKTPGEREALFGRMRKGEARFLIGSTFRMGVGVNVQERCYAVHHMTTPWRPCDVKQADGRIWRPGNLFPEVWIFRYVAAPSFDGFSWQGIETKGKFEDAYLRGDPSVRVMSDIDEQIVSAGEIKALASGDPRIVQKVRLEHELDKLRQQRTGWEGTRRNARTGALRAEQEAQQFRERLLALKAAAGQRSAAPSLTLLGKDYDLSNPATYRALGKDLRDSLVNWAADQDAYKLKRIGFIRADVGTYRGLTLYAVLELDSNGKMKLPWMYIGHQTDERLTRATVPIGDRGEIINRMEDAATDLERTIAYLEGECERFSADAARIRATLDEPWEYERTYRLMELGLRYLNAVLSEDQSETEKVIAEVLALAESEGLDIEAIIKEGQAIEEKGVDLSAIRVQLPPLPTAEPLALESEVPAAVLATKAPAPIAPAPVAPRSETPSLDTSRIEKPAEQGNYISLSLFADPLPIARPTLEVASLDLKDMATEAARKKAEISNKKRQKQLDAGQASFLSF